jgi:hypothetical protein
LHASMIRPAPSPAAGMRPTSLPAGMTRFSPPISPRRCRSRMHSSCVVSPGHVAP